MSEYLNGGNERWKAWEKMEKTKERGQRAEQVEDLHTILNETNRRGVILRANLDRAGMSDYMETDFVSVIGKEDLGGIVNALEEEGYIVETVSLDSGARLIIHSEGKVEVAHDFVIGENTNDSDIMKIGIGDESKVSLRISNTEKAKFGNAEVPLVGVYSQEAREEYYKALEDGDLQRVVKIKKLITAKEVRDIEYEYRQEHPEVLEDEGKVSSSQELFREELKEEGVFEQEYEVEEAKFEFKFEDLQRQIIKAQMELDGMLDELKIGRDRKMTTNELYGLLVEEGKLDLDEEVGNWGDSEKIIAALPNMKGEYTRDELVINIEEFVLDAVDRWMIDGGNLGDKHELTLSVAKRKLETADVTGQNKASQGV